MPEGIVGSFGGKVAEHWSSQLFTPAFAFWTGGIGLWCLQDDNWCRLHDELAGMSQSMLIVLAVFGLLLVASSATVAQKFEPLVIRALEGYGWPRFLRGPFLLWQTSRYNDAMRTYQAASTGGATPKHLRRFDRAVATLQRIPPSETDRMPTSLGNILRFSERVSDWRYGLDSIVCWSRIWLLLPDGAKKELADARADLDVGARAWFWGMLFVVWSGITILALAIAILVCVGAYWWMKNAASVYGDLIQAVFDVYRPSLYNALRIPMAPNAGEERNAGIALSSYLANGSDNPALVFAAPPEEPTIT